MAQELAIHEPAKALSLPEWLGRLAFGTVDQPGQPTRRYLAGGLSLTPSQRAEAEARRSEILAALNPNMPGADRARGVVLAKMVMAYPMAGMGEKAAEARGDAYRDALDDMPPWAVAAAVRCWNRGSCGDHNYSFAPAPAVLRKVCEQVVLPYRDALTKLHVALSAVTIERAMDTEPLPVVAGLPQLRAVR